MDNIDILENLILKQKVTYYKDLNVGKDVGFVHEHDGFPEHPIGVKYHSDYFSSLGREDYEFLKPRQRKTPSGLNIPKNWTDTFVAKRSGSALQAFGYDSKGRKQYLYSKVASKRNAAKKFNRLSSFAKSFSGIMTKISRDVKKSEEAQILYIISKTGFRIGSDKDTLANVKAYGISTLFGEHINISGTKVSFNFVGKKGVVNTKTIDDPIIASILNSKKLKKGQQIFSSTDNDVRKYMHGLTGKPFLIKDFRTYLGTSAAYEAIKTLPVPQNESELKKNRNIVATKVSEVLGNTPAVALNSYISPEVFSPWLAHLEQKGIQIKKEEETFEDFLDSIHYGDEDLSDYEIEEEEDYDDEEMEDREDIDKNNDSIQKQWVPKTFKPIKDIVSRFKQQHSGKLAQHTHEEGTPSGHEEGGTVFPLHPVSVKHHKEYFEGQQEQKETGKKDRGDLFKPNQFEIERRFTLYKQLITDETSKDIFNRTQEFKKLFTSGPPASHLLKAKKITIEPEAFLGEEREIGLCYEDGEIIISGLGDNNTISHEIGHALKMSPTGRSFPEEFDKEIEEIYNFCIEKDAGFPSNYAKTDKEEFFAECYAAFIHNNKHFLKRNATMYDFIKKIFDFFKDHDDVFLETGIAKSQSRILFRDPEGVGEFNFDLPDLEEGLEKDVGFQHKHDNWPEHPLRVGGDSHLPEGHRKYFQGKVTEQKPVKQKERANVGIKDKTENEIDREISSFSKGNWGLGTIQDIFSGIDDVGINIVNIEAYLDAELSVSIDILDKNTGNYIGEMERSFARQLDDDGIERITVEHSNFDIIKSYQGKGIASKLLDSMEEEYKMNGVYSIELEANADIGGYAWALQGYDFSSELQLKRMKSYFSNILKKNLAGEKITNKQFDTLFRQVQKFKHSWEFASWNPQNKPWGEHLGKKWMLGSSWHGTKFLANDSQGYQIGKLYREKKSASL